MKELLQEMIFITIALYAIGKSDVSVKVVFLYLFLSYCLIKKSSSYETDFIVSVIFIFVQL